jgi:excisionase family DNA binding protein
MKLVQAKEAAMESHIRDNYINIDEAADYLGVKPATIRTWIKSRNLPAHRVGKLWKFKRSEIDAWVESGKSSE